MDTEDDHDKPTLMEFTSATSHVTQSEVSSSGDIQEIEQRRRRERKEKKQKQLESARTVKAIIPPSPKTSSLSTSSIPIVPPIASIRSDNTEIPRFLERPLEPELPILPTIADFKMLTEDATQKYKRFMDIIASGIAELDQMKIKIVEKITIHERVITDQMTDIDGSSKNATMIRSDLDIVWNNCQTMKV